MIQSSKISEKNQGFTFLEFIIVAAIIVFLMAVAVPNYTRVAAQNRITAAANELVILLRLAKTEAIRTRQNVVVCASANGTTCSSVIQKQFIMFNDKNKNGQVNSGETIKKLIHIPHNVIISTTETPVFSFNNLGMLDGYVGATVMTASNFCSSMNPSETKSVVLGASEIEINKNIDVHKSSC